MSSSQKESSTLSNIQSKKILSDLLANLKTPSSSSSKREKFEIFEKTFLPSFQKCLFSSFPISSSHQELAFTSVDAVCSCYSDELQEFRKSPNRKTPTKEEEGKPNFPCSATTILQLVPLLKSFILSTNISHSEETATCLRAVDSLNIIQSLIELAEDSSLVGGKNNLPQQFVAADDFQFVAGLVKLLSLLREEKEEKQRLSICSFITHNLKNFIHLLNQEHALQLSRLLFENTCMDYSYSALALILTHWISICFGKSIKEERLNEITLMIREDLSEPSTLTQGEPKNNNNSLSRKKLILKYLSCSIFKVLTIVQSKNHPLFLNTRLGAFTLADALCCLVGPSWPFLAAEKLTELGEEKWVTKNLVGGISTIDCKKSEFQKKGTVSANDLIALLVRMVSIELRVTIYCYFEESQHKEEIELILFHCFSLFESFVRFFLGELFPPTVISSALQLVQHNQETTFHKEYCQYSWNNLPTENLLQCRDSLSDGFQCIANVICMLRNEEGKKQLKTTKQLRNCDLMFNDYFQVNRKLRGDNKIDEIFFNEEERRNIAFIHCVKCINRWLQDGPDPKIGQLENELLVQKKIIKDPSLCGGLDTLLYFANTTFSPLFPLPDERILTITRARSALLNGGSQFVIPTLTLWCEELEGGKLKALVQNSFKNQHCFVPIILTKAALLAQTGEQELSRFSKNTTLIPRFELAIEILTTFVQYCKFLILHLHLKRFLASPDQDEIDCVVLQKYLLPFCLYEIPQSLIPEKLHEERHSLFFFLLQTQACALFLLFHIGKNNKKSIKSQWYEKGRAILHRCYQMMAENDTLHSFIIADFALTTV